MATVHIVSISLIHSCLSLKRSWRKEKQTHIHIRIHEEKVKDARWPSNDEERKKKCPYVRDASKRNGLEPDWFLCASRNRINQWPLLHRHLSLLFACTLPLLIVLMWFSPFVRPFQWYLFRCAAEWKEKFWLSLLVLVDSEKRKRLCLKLWFCLHLNFPLTISSTLNYSDLVCDLKLRLVTPEWE